MSKKVSFQVLSDVHTEIFPFNYKNFPAKAKYLILAGDIGNLSRDNKRITGFLNYCSANWKYVIYVPGNHEYYSDKLSIQDLNKVYKHDICGKYPNVVFLESEGFHLEDEDVMIYGTTFWTKPPFKTLYEAQSYVNDYNHIMYSSKDLTIDNVSTLSATSYDKLKLFLESNNKKTIVVTHFPPHTAGTSDPKFTSDTGRAINKYFAWSDNTLETISHDNIVAWISGHTHWSYDFVQNGVRLIGNQLGYTNERGKTGVALDAVYEIETETAI